MQPGSVVPLQYSELLVLLSFVISALGAYVALVAASRIRDDDGRISKGYLVVSAFALGGIGIWGMHFIGMAAQRMPFPVSYSLWPTLGSLLLAVVVSGVALWYVARSPYRNAGRCIVGGVAGGFGVAGMHYLGMSAVRTQAYFEWDTTIVALSVLIAIVAASVALWLAFHLETSLQRALAALVMAVAVCGMHYTGMRAGTIICTADTRAEISVRLQGDMLPYGVFAIACVVLLAMAVLLYRTSRRRRERMAARLDALMRQRAGHT
ncbi:MHYT domain-containing protein [Pandoraea pulmonicola]|uniref:MHYT domain (Predicted integral membrane sensor domain) n=1 Tax=Pandoraea pulmonicola TaxID=93221 RepID=A0AAJ4ZCV1_PANPU|nr:MHYT domain-containing protein [Pandoraea pulmonicola]AJC20502.1 signal protein [Pandoraea pulmonicola]SUA91078.1 MHYT domain (predicted integral membrane sensor domain) [Pandoraea pulmonicola]